MSSFGDLYDGLSLEDPSVPTSEAGGLVAGVETVPMAEAEEEEKGKREPMFGDTFGSAAALGKFQKDLESRKGEKKVEFGPKVEPKTGPKGVGKPQKFVNLKDAPGTSTCCALIKSTTGPNMFCGETLVSGAKGGKLECPSTRAHNNSKVERMMDLPYPSFWVPQAKTRGRGGIRVVPDKQLFILHEEVPDSMVDKFMTQEFLKKDAKGLIVVCQVATSGGTEEDQVVKQLFQEDVFKECYTPARRVTKSLPDSDGSMGAWDFIQEEDVLKVPSFEDFKERASNLTHQSSPGAKSPFMPELRAILDGLNSNVGLLHGFVKEADKKTIRSFNKIFETTNKLALFVAKLDGMVGDPKSFVGDEDVTSAFEGLTYLREQLALTQTDIEATIGVKEKLWASRADKMEVQIAALDETERKHRLVTDGLDESIKELKGNVADVFKSSGTLKEKFLNPLGIMYKKFQGNGVGQDVVSRLARLENQSNGTATSARPPNDLFGAGLTGFFDESGTEVGSPAQFKRLNNLCTDVQSENARLRQEVNELKNLVESTVKKDQQATGSEVGQSDLHKLELRISALEFQGHYIKINKWTFNGIADCIRFLRTKMVWDENHGVLPEDMVALAHGCGDLLTAAGVDEVMSRDHHTARAGFMNESTANVYASMKSVLPKPLTTSSITKTSSPLPRLSKFEIWDEQDGRTGLRYDITQAIESRHAQVLNLYEAELGEAHVDAYFLYKEVIDGALSHWRKTAEYLSSTFAITYKVCEDEKEAWQYASEVIKGLLTELHSVRAVGAHRSVMGKFTIEDAGRMLWGVLRCHSLMTEFSKTLSGLETHPKLASYVLHHLFRNRVTPKQFDTAKGQVAQLERRLKKLESK